MMNILIIGNLAEKPTFNYIESELKKLGHFVINPSREFTTVNDEVYVARRYLDAIAACTAVFFIPDYFNMPNAALYQSAVKALKLPNIQNAIKLNLNNIS